MSYIWLSFCSGTSHYLEFSTTSNSHAARENLPHLVALWNLSEIWSGNAVEWEKTKANRQQELVNFSTGVAVVVFCSFVLFFLFLLLLSIKHEKNTLALIAHAMKMPFLALELPRFLTFDMDQLGKHRAHHWKKRLKISKTGNLIWKWYSSASCEILQMFVWWRGKGLCLPHPTIPMSGKLRSFEEPYLRYFWQQITFKLGNRINLKALFPAELTDCP